MSDAVGGVGSFKDRIGRVRFLLEFSIGVAVVQVSNSHPIAPTVVLGIGLLVALGRFAQRLRYGVKNKWGIGVSLFIAALIVMYGVVCVINGIPRPEDTIKTNTMPIAIVGIVIPLLTLSLGVFLVLRASVKRLRDIKRSVWWATLLLAPIILGLFYGFSGKLHSPKVDFAYIQIIWVPYMIAFLWLMGSLLSRPSAFPNDVGATAFNELSTANKEKEAANVLFESKVDDSAPVRAKGIALNGWQRIGVILSALWLCTAAGIAGNDYYESYSHYSSRLEAAASLKECRDKARKGANVEANLEQCPMSFEDFSGTPIPKSPPSPPVLTILSLLVLPIAVGWFLVLLAIRATKWVRKGFKEK